MPVSLSEFSLLIKPAVYEDPLAIGLEEKTRARNILGGSQEANFNTHNYLAVAKKKIVTVQGLYCETGLASIELVPIGQIF